MGGLTPGTAGADNDNITIQNNAITVASVGIYANGTASVSAGGLDNLSLMGNSVTTTNTVATIGIQAGNALNSAITANTISVETSTFTQPVGISLETGFVSSTVTQNTITKVLVTDAGGYGGRGITIGTGTATSNLTVANNVIYGVNGSNWSAFSNSSSMGIGIGVSGGGSLTTTTGGVNFYYNTVNMTGSMGTASTTALTTALYVGSGASALNVQNNILVNTQVATSATQKNYAIYAAVANTAFTNINNNAYFVSNTFNAASAVLGFIGGDRTDLPAIVAGFGQNASSISASPLFTSSTNLLPTNIVIDNKGAVIAITTDILNITRSVSTPDVGAYEFVGVDLVPPVISYTALSNVCASTPSRVLVATITDISGVPTSGAGLPMLYWRLNAGAYTGVQAVSLGSNQYQFTFGPATVANDIISYYVVAQDTYSTVNFASFPALGASGFSANPPAATTPPTTPSNYTHGPGLVGTYTVGATGNYSTLTAAITAFNAGCETGAVVFELIDTSYPSETFPIVINQIPSASTNTLTIRPSSTVGAVTISGSHATSLIDLNGADYVTINGTNGTSTLTISNIAVGTTANTIRLLGDATFNTITNATVLGSGSVLGAAVINVGSVVTTGNNNNTFSNNTISAAGLNFPTTGIISFSGSAITNAQNTITNNNFVNIFNPISEFSAININGGNTAWTITNNKIFQTALRTVTAASSSVGISITSGTGYTINNNVIGFADALGNGTTTYTSTLAFNYTPIAIGGLVVGVVNNVQGNIVANINITTASVAAMFNGIFLAGAGDVNVGTVTPNIIGSATGTDAISITASASGGTFFGIRNTATGIINISNNITGSMTAIGSTPTVALSVIGINSSAGTNIITGNAIGSADTPSSINSSTVATAGSQTVLGISATSSLPTTISNNTISNLNQASTTVGAVVRGIVYSGSGAGIINGNTVSNLFGASANTAQTGISSVTGIASTGFAPTITISQNTVFALANLNAGAVATHVLGIGYSSATAGTISKNKVYDIRNASTMAIATTPPTAVGILLRTGGVTVANNMVSLGDAETTNTIFIGISNNVTTTLLNIYHNSVYIAGSAGSGALPSFGFSRADFSATAVTSPVDIRNNIFYNNRSGGTGIHYAIGNNFGATASATGWGANASNYNLLYAAVAGNIGHWTTALDFTGWNTASAGGANSISNTLGFFDTVAGDLHLIAPYTVPFDGLGINIPTILDDFDGQARASNTPIDMGADAGNFFEYPTITYTPLGNNCSTGATSLVANISNANGVPTSGTGLPRLYWRINAGGYQSSVATSLGSGNYQFSLGTGSVVSDVISYYIVAQDNFGNVGSTPALGASGFSTNPPATTTPPSTPSTYTNIPTLVGTYLVGATGFYPTLTAAVNAYNTNCLGGAVTFALKSDYTSTGETFPIVINANAQASTINTLTIRPDAGATPTISGTSTSALIRLNGARFVTIDGSNTVGGTTKDLTVTNTNTTGIFGTMSIVSLGVATGTLNSAILNCNISTGVSTGLTYGIAIGGLTPGTSGADNDNITVQNNAITVASVGIYANGTASVSVGGLDNLSLIGNSVNTTNTVATIGIQVGNALNSAITANTISVETIASTQPVGISLETGFVSSAVTQNIITKALTTATGGYGGRGITIGTGTATSNLTVANNVIYGVNGSNYSSFTNSSSMGIAIGMIGGSGTLTTTTGGVNLYYNSVNMAGSYTYATPCITAALYVGVGASALDVRNNIFVNSLNNTDTGTGVGSKNYTVYSAGTNTAFTTLNNNGYFVSGTQGVLGFIGSDRTNLAGVVTGFGQNANAVNANPTFVSPTNLLPTSCALDNKAVTIGGITTDFAGITRTATPDIGAYEFASVLTIAPATLSNATLNAAYTQALTQTGIAGTLTWSVSAGALPTGMTLSAAGSLSGTPLMAGTFNFTAQVTDGICTTTRAYALVVDCPVTTISPATLSNGTLGSAYTQTLTTNLIGTITWSVSVGSLPTGVSLNTTTGVLSGTPTVAGLFNFTIDASSSAGCSATPRAYSFTVDCPTMAITTVSLPNGTLSTIYTATTLAQTGLPTPMWSVLVGTLPTGLSLNTSTGEVSGTPTVLGTFAFTIKAEQSTCNITKAFSIDIVCPMITFTNTTASAATVSTAYNLNAVATGNTTALTYSVLPALPAGLTLDTSTGAISGTPTAPTASATYTVTAAQSGPCAVTQAYTFAVDCPTITFTNTTASVATVGTAYSLNAVATGNTTVLTYSVSPALPAGLTLDTSTGAISGTPTASTASATYMVTASQSGPCAVTQAYTFAVGCPTLTMLPAGAFLPDAIVNTVYSQTLSVTGLSGTYTWTLTTGTMPTGLSLNATTGEISGTPTVLSINNLTFTATHESGCSISVLYELDIVNLPGFTTQPLDAAVCPNATATFTVVVSSFDPATVQWEEKIGAGAFTALSNVAPYSGVTSNTLTISPASLVMSGRQYRCVATNPTGSVPSNIVTLTTTDLINPVLTVPANITFNASSGDVNTCGQIVNYTLPTATDNCTAVAAITINRTAGPASGATFPLGVTTVTYIATDEQSNVDTKSFTVTVVDDVDPIAITQNISKVLGVGNTVSITAAEINNGSTDNCAGTFTYSVSPSTFDCTNLGVNTVTLTVTDANGNDDTETAIVTITEVVAPVLTLPTNITVNTDTNLCTAVVNYTVSATDNCTASGAIILNRTAGLASGSAFPKGVTTVTYTATDASGNASTPLSFTVTVNDAQDPTVVGCPANITVNNTTGLNSAVVTYTDPTSADNCPSSTIARTTGLASGAAFPLGVTTITHIATDAVGNTATCTFTVTVNFVNATPTFTASTPTTILEDAGAQSIANWATGNDNDEAVQTLSYVMGTVGTPSLFSVAPSVSSTGILTYTPALNANGTSTFQVAVKDNGGVANGGVDQSAFQTFTITVTAVNDMPSFTASNPPASLEDAGAQTVTSWVTTNSTGPADESVQTLTYEIGTIGTPALFSVAPAVSATGTLTYTAAPNAFGTSTFQVRTRDNGGVADGGIDVSAYQDFTITVGNVNDIPSFAAITPPTVLEDAGAQSVANFVTTNSAGSANESTQTLSYVMGTVGTPSLFSVAPSVSSTGILTYTPALNANGTSTFQVAVKDNGGVVNGGVDQSAFQTFTITVTAVNDMPSFTASNPPSSLEDAGAQTVTSWVATNSTGPADESTQTLAYEIGTVGTPTLFSVAPAVSPTGTLTYTAAPNAFGTSTVQVRVRDNGGVANAGVDASAYQDFIITVTNVNDVPTFTALATIPTVLEDAGAQTVTGFVTASSAGVNEIPQIISYEIGTISNTALFGTSPSVSATGVLTYTAAPNANGTSTFQVRIKDNGGVANAGVDASAFQTFTINVTAVNDEPKLDAIVDIEQLGGTAKAITLTGIATGGGADEIAQTFTVTATVISGDASIFDGAITATPVTGGTSVLNLKTLKAGTATIRVIVQDNGLIANGGDDSVERIFTVRATNQDEVFVPSIFSPNGDGDNDFFRVNAPVAAVKSIKLEVFDNQGNLVFSTDLVDRAVTTGWDGKRNGTDQPQGVYGWKLSGVYQDGRAIKATDGVKTGINKGVINLIRGTK